MSQAEGKITDKPGERIDEQQIFQYIRSYCEDVPVDGGTFLVGTENHLKKILYGIEQRYYTTPLGNEKRLANSILKLTND